MNGNNITGALSRFGKKTLMATGAITCALLIGAGAFAHGKGDRFEGRVNRVAEELQLNDEQRKALHAVAADLQQKRRTLREEAREKIRGIVLSEQMSRGDALQILRMRREGRELFEEYAAERFVAFHATLNNEQREKAAMMLEQAAGKRGWRHLGKKRRTHGWKFWRHHDDDDDDHHDRRDRDDD